MSRVKEVLSVSLFPKRCRLCGEVIAPDETYCDDCRNAEKVMGSVCRKCGVEKQYCHCKRDKFSPSYKGFCAPYYYKGSIVKGVYRFKNHGFSELAEAYAQEIVGTVHARYPDITFDIVTFVPMTAFRKWRRGYNQSELLAKQVAALMDIPCLPLLRKIRHTKSQRKLTARERKVNLYGAFQTIRNTDLKGKAVLLIDDVKTTGSTLSALAAELKSEGATVYAASFAVVCRDKK